MSNKRKPGKQKSKKSSFGEAVNLPDKDGTKSSEKTDNPNKPEASCETDKNKVNKAK